MNDRSPVFLCGAKRSEIIPCGRGSEECFIATMSADGPESLITVRRSLLRLTLES